MSPASEPELLLAFQALEPAGTGRFDWRHPLARRAQSAVARAALARATSAANAPAGDWPSHPDGGLAPRADGAGHTWHASLSHARQGAVAALMRGGAVGVDLERADRPRPLHVGTKLAELGADRAALEDPERLIALWTRVEALLKRERVGLPGWSRIQVPGVVPPTGEALLGFDGHPRWTHAQRHGDFWLSCAAESPCRPRLLPAVEPRPLSLPESSAPGDSSAPPTSTPTPRDAPPSDAPGS